MILTLKIVAAVILTVLIDYVGRGKYGYLSAIIPLFPTFGIFAFLSVDHSAENMTTRFVTAGLLSLLPYAAFLVASSFSLQFSPTYVSVLIGIAVWTVIASLVVILV